MANINDDDEPMDSDTQSNSDDDNDSDFSGGDGDSTIGGDDDDLDLENDNDNNDSDNDNDSDNEKGSDNDDDNKSDTSEIHINRKAGPIAVKRQKKAATRALVEDEDADIGAYLQKFDIPTHQQLLAKHHPELASINPQEMYALAKVVRDNTGKIIDPLHTTVPFITKYERTHVIGVRASQLEHGNPPFIELADNVIDSHTIALMEYNEKQLPFIIARPMPAGGVEYWHINDLERV